jgi:hypothetical protein
VGDFVGLSECWNAVLDDALVRAREPWVLVLNDDVGFEPGVLAVGVAAAWARHATHAAVFVNSNEPGMAGGNLFSAFAITRLGYLAVGSMDENFFPAYFEDCDWFYRLKVLGLRWHVERAWNMLHPLPLTTDAAFDACVAAAPAAAREAALERATALRRMVNSSTDGPIGRQVEGGPPFPHPAGHREYYMRKWGTAPEDCGYGNFEAPFNDARAAVGDWTFDATRRRAFLAANGL